MRLALTPALLAGLTMVVMAVWVDSAAGKPRVETVRVTTGFTAAIAGVGCAPGSVSRALLDGEVVAAEPPIGEDVGDLDSLLVTDVVTDAGQVRWTVQPSATECAFHAQDPSWSWSSDMVPWSVTQRASKLAIRASDSGGLRAIAGFRVNRLTRGGSPTIGRARRHFGRPSSIRRRYDVGCRARWNHIGLTLDFINLGGRHPCKHGFLQAGRVLGPAAHRWVSIVGARPGVPLGSTEGWLQYASDGEAGDQGRWTLAEVYIPYGDGGYAPSLSALLTAGGTVRGFEFWVGAGGD